MSQAENRWRVYSVQKWNFEKIALFSCWKLFLGKHVLHPIDLSSKFRKLVARRLELRERGVEGLICNVYNFWSFFNFVDK